MKFIDVVFIAGFLDINEVIGNIATGYAITYIFGLVGLISIIKLLPQWLGIDLVEEARRFTDATTLNLWVQVGTKIGSQAFRSGADMHTDSVVRSPGQLQGSRKYPTN